MTLIISRHGIPFIVSAAIYLAAASYVSLNWNEWGRYPIMLSGVLLLILFLTFFRDPERLPPPEEGLILAPADGRVIRVTEENDDSFPEKKGIRVAIFMSLWNVHVNRVPISGRVVRKTCTEGSFLPAFRDEASQRNEQCNLLIENGGRTILLRQICGLIARRIITYPEEGDQVTRGDRLGMILFGSRVELLLPIDCVVRVRSGQKTIAGQTVVGTL